MGTAGGRGWKVVLEKCFAVICSVQHYMQDYVQVCARFCVRLLSRCAVLWTDFEVELVMGWSKRGGGRWWTWRWRGRSSSSTADLLWGKIHRAVDQSTNHHTGFDSLMQSAKPYSKQTFCPDAKINTYFQTLLKEIKERLTWLLLHTFCFQSRSAETFSDLCSFSASPL